jgi:hypothetical protein
MLKLEDLKCYDNMYYIGDIVDVDGSPWVFEDEAIKIIKEENWREYVEMKCKEDEIDRELNTKWRHANWINHCKESWTKDIQNIK